MPKLLGAVLLRCGVGLPKVLLLLLLPIDIVIRFVTGMTSGIAMLLPPELRVGGPELYSPAPAPKSNGTGANADRRLFLQPLLPFVELPNAETDLRLLACPGDTSPSNMSEFSRDPLGMILLSYGCLLKREVAMELMEPKAPRTPAHRLVAFGPS